MSCKIEWKLLMSLVATGPRHSQRLPGPQEARAHPYSEKVSCTFATQYYGSAHSISCELSEESISFTERSR